MYMSDTEYRSRLGSHAGYYFALTALELILFEDGVSGVLKWTTAIYLVFGSIIATVTIGSLNHTISKYFERRANLKYGQRGCLLSTQ